jgi:hypothetical protein
MPVEPEPKSAEFSFDWQLLGASMNSRRWKKHALQIVYTENGRLTTCQEHANCAIEQTGKCPNSQIRERTTGQAAWHSKVNLRK